MKKKTSELTIEDREELREKIARDVEKYLAKGGKITQCPPRTYSTPAISYSSWHSDPDSNERTGLKGYNLTSITDPIKRLIGAYIPRLASDKNEN